MKKGVLYRADIDGLRAVAVVSVLLFHLHVLGFGGGYVGVDVFFVISGYLITGFIHMEMQAERFSLRDFYLRRVRRIVPALLLLSIPVAVTAWIVLYPEDLRSFAASLALQFTALQNVLFLSEGQYFRGSETKPLLHTWSLAVEEQFYLFWPLLLLASRRLGLTRRMLIIGALLVGSFALNLALFVISPKASFFLLPPRAWELGAGGVIAILEQERAFATWLTDKWRSAFGAIGMAAIVGSVIGFSDTTSFPGYAALLPVFGTGFVVIAGIGGVSPVGRLLARPTLVHIGLISYPLYLWHWPLIAFCHYAHVDPATLQNALIILAASVGFAEISYRWVETPIRGRHWLPTARALLTATGATAALLTALAAHLYTTEGAAYRFPATARALLTAPFHARTDRCGFLFRAMNPRSQVCALRDDEHAERRVLLWGNSHADMWSNLLTTFGSKYRASVFLNARNCRATPDTPFCGMYVQEAILKFVSSERVTDVVLASAWYGLYEVKDEDFEKSLDEVVGKLAGLGVRIWLVTDTPQSPSFDPIAAFEQNPEAPRFGSVAVADFLPRKHKEEAFFTQLAKRHRNVRIIDASAGLCDRKECVAGVGAVAWYRDAGHLTDAGAMTAASGFLPIFVH